MGKCFWSIIEQHFKYIRVNNETKISGCKSYGDIGLSAKVVYEK